MSTNAPGGHWDRGSYSCEDAAVGGDGGTRAWVGTTAPAATGYPQACHTAAGDGSVRDGRGGIRKHSGLDCSSHDEASAAAVVRKPDRRVSFAIGVVGGDGTTAGPARGPRYARGCTLAGGDAGGVASSSSWSRPDVEALRALALQRQQDLARVASGLGYEVISPPSETTATTGGCCGYCSGPSHRPPLSGIGSLVSSPPSGSVGVICEGGREGHGTADVLANGGDVRLSGESHGVPCPRSSTAYALMSPDDHGDSSWTGSSSLSPHVEPGLQRGSRGHWFRPRDPTALPQQGGLPDGRLPPEPKAPPTSEQARCSPCSGDDRGPMTGGDRRNCNTTSSGSLSGGSTLHSCRATDPEAMPCVAPGSHVTTEHGEAVDGGGAVALSSSFASPTESVGSAWGLFDLPQSSPLEAGGSATGPLASTMVPRSAASSTTQGSLFMFVSPQPLPLGPPLFPSSLPTPQPTPSAPLATSASSSLSHMDGGQGLRGAGATASTVVPTTAALFVSTLTSQDPGPLHNSSDTSFDVQRSSPGSDNGLFSRSTIVNIPNVALPATLRASMISTAAIATASPAPDAPARPRRDGDLTPPLGASAVAATTGHVSPPASGQALSVGRGGSGRSRLVAGLHVPPVDHTHDRSAAVPSASPADTVVDGPGDPQDGASTGTTPVVNMPEGFGAPTMATMDTALAAAVPTGEVGGHRASRGDPAGNIV